MGYKYILKKTISTQIFWLPPRTEIPSHRKMVSSIGTSVLGWNDEEYIG